MKCRHCGFALELPLVNLGSAPPSNAYLTQTTLMAPEKWFPLSVLVCQNCWLVQTEDFAQAEELFDANYAYFSGFSSSWLAHCQRYVADMTARFHLGIKSHVVEVAANDGYLLQFFQERKIPCTGVEPTAAPAEAARAKGIEIVQDFFGSRLAREMVAHGKQADLTAANNVLAHVPDINDFVAGFSILLKPEGIATFEFPHLHKLISGLQFDTIYHEHFSYLSLTAVDRIFTANGLSIIDVEEHPTHGGSLRIFAQRSDTGSKTRTSSVDGLLKREFDAGMTTAGYYAGFQVKINKVKNDFLSFLLEAQRNGRSIAAYGAAAKGNTLINYAGIRSDLVQFVVDLNPAKQGKYMPGSQIPIMDESHLKKSKPDYIVILPWNLKQEISQQLQYIREWGGQFVTAIPFLEIQS